MYLLRPMKLEQFIKGKTAIIGSDVFEVVKAIKPVPGAFANIVDEVETTVVSKEGTVKRKNTLRIEKGWKQITFECEMPFELTGFLAKVAGALAKEEVPIYAISTYSTDHLFIKKKNEKKAAEALAKLGFRVVKESNSKLK